MRVLFICADHGIPAFGRKGASTHLREMIAAFRAEGAEVALAAADLSGDRRPEEDFQALALPRPTSGLLGFDGRYALGDCLSEKPLDQLARSFQPQAIYERSALYFRAGSGLAERRRLPRILEVNTLLSEEMATRLHFPRLAKAAEARIIRRASGVAAISSVMKRRLEAELGLPQESVRVFTMAVDPDRFSARGRRAELRSRLGFSPETVVLGYIGSMNHYHKPGLFFDMLEALASQPPQAPVAALIVGGSDSKVERYRARAAALAPALSVHFEGTVPQEDIPGWVEAMDLVVVPGAAPQSTPTKIFEVAAVGTPLLLPRTEPIRELAGGHAEGLLFEEDGQEEIVGRIRAFLNDRAPIVEANRRLRERVLRDHTWRGHARHILAWMAELRP